jgi:hypothetical protein
LKRRIRILNSAVISSQKCHFLSEDEITSANALFRLEGDYDIPDRGRVEAHLLYYFNMEPLDPFSGFKEGSIYDRIIDRYYQETIDGIAPVLDDLTADERELLFKLLEIYSSGYFDHLSYSSFYPKETIVMDRALIRLYFDRADLTFGKQQIAWGTGYAFNPTDIWNIKDPSNPDGPKIGVLASSVEFFYGENSSVNIIAAPGSDFNHMRYGLRAKSSIDRFEYSFSAIRDRSDDGSVLDLPERIQVGADFAGEIINEIGIFGEAALSNPRYTGMEMSDTDSAYVQICAGMDYTFKNGLYLLGEYYYNGLGERDNDFDLKAFTRLTGGLMSGLSRNYFSAVFMYPFLRYYKVSLITLANLDDGSCVTVPELEYSFHENLSIRINSNIYIGSSSDTEYGGLINKITFNVTGYF